MFAVYNEPASFESFLSALRRLRIALLDRMLPGFNDARYGANFAFLLLKLNFFSTEHEIHKKTSITF